jgi:hypothetical protein
MVAAPGSQRRAVGPDAGSTCRAAVPRGNPDLRVGSGEGVWLDGAVRNHARWLAAGVLTLLLATTLTTTEAATRPRPLGRAKARVQGTWVLQQIMSRSQLARMRPELEAALRVPGVTGFSIRVPWTLLEPRKGHYDFRVLRRALRIARPKELSVRFIAGTYTPAFWRGNSFVYDGSETFGVGAGQLVPLPFNRDGGPNRVFERGWERMVNHLARWSKRRHLALLHLAWPGLVWSEMGVVDQMFSEPGYSYRQARNTHLRLLNHGFKVSTRSMHIEFPWAGFVPQQMYIDLKRRVMSHPLRGRLILLANNLTDHTAPLQRERPPPRRAAQMLQPEGYDWSAVYDDARTMYAEYVEIYTPSFTTGSAADRDELRAEIRRFAQG